LAKVAEMKSKPMSTLSLKYKTSLSKLISAALIVLNYSCQCRKCAGDSLAHSQQWQGATCGCGSVCRCLTALLQHADREPGMSGPGIAVTAAGPGVWHRVRAHGQLPSLGWQGRSSCRNGAAELPQT